jgi:hypothetical protein
MTVRAFACGLAGVLFAAVAVAQQRPIFDPDDFVDPRGHGAIFMSRLTIGGALNLADDYRPLRRDAGFVHVTNAFYWRRIEFDYKHSEVLAKNPPPVRICACSPPQYFPTPPPGNATPAPPPAGSKDFLQFGWYHSMRNRSLGPPVMLRLRLSLSLQKYDTRVSLPGTDEAVARLQAREQSIGLDADVYLPIFGHNVFGSVRYARTARSGAPDPRKQHEFTYTNRLPAAAIGSSGIILRPEVTVGRISNRGGTAINLVNPTFDTSLYESKTRVSLHLIYSPQITNDGAHGWHTTHQIALFADRALFVKLFH